MLKVHCLGVIVVDALSAGLAAYPVPRQKPQVQSQSLRMLPGGGAANTGAALGQMQVPVAIFSKVGKDSNGTFVLETLAQYGVDVAGVRVSAQDITPFTYVGIHPEGERTFIHTPGANKTFCAADIDLKALLNCGLLLYQDLWALPALDGRDGAAILAAAQKKGVTTLLDECYGLGPNKEVFEQTCRFADYVLPSYDDLLAIYPRLSPEEMLTKLHGLGVKKVVLKMGKAGCVVSAGHGAAKVPSQAAKIVDTTGAGDCFDAGFIAGLANKLSDLDSARLGSLAAAACIENVGGAVGIPRFEDLLAKLKKGEKA